MAQKGKPPAVPLETFSKVVEAIYDCALDPNRWPTAISLISDMLQSQRCALAVHNHVNHRNELAFQLGIENNDYWRQHEETYSRINPLFVPMLMQPVGAVATRSMVVSDDEIFESRFYKEWAKPQGLHDVVGVKVLHTDQRQGFLTADRVVVAAALWRTRSTTADTSFAAYLPRGRDL